MGITPPRPLLFFAIGLFFISNLVEAARVRKGTLQSSVFVEIRGMAAQTHRAFLSSGPRDYSITDSGTNRYYQSGVGLGLNLAQSVIFSIGGLYHRTLTSTGTVVNNNDPEQRWDYVRDLSGNGAFAGLSYSVLSMHRVAIRLFHETEYTLWKLQQTFGARGTASNDTNVTLTARGQNLLFSQGLSFEFILTDNWGLQVLGGYRIGQLNSLSTQGRTTVLGRVFEDQESLKDADGNTLRVDFKSPIIGVNLRSWYF